MVDKRQQILDLVKEYIIEKRQSERWTPGEDWISYSGPTFDDTEYVAAIDSLLSEWLIFGKKGREFELEFAQYLGKKAGVLTNSGSSANLLAVSALKSRKWLNLKSGTKFITPVVCFPTTINPLIQNGFVPVFVDVTLPDLNLDLDQVERLLEDDPEIRGIMFAHVLGNPPDMDRLMFLVKKYNLVFVEDACDALGSYYDGRLLGSFGTVSTCSFFPAHHMTMGEGGFVATDSNVKRMVLASYRDWGRACYCNTAKPGSVTSGTACGNRFQKWLPGMKTTTFDHRYVFDEIGYNLKPLDLAAAMGLEQIKKLPMLDEARRKNFKRLKEIFAPYEDFFHLPEPTFKADPCWFGFLLTIRDGASIRRQEFVDFMESKKIQTRSYFTGLVLAHPGYIHLAKDYGILERTFPVAAKVTHDSFFLGTYVGLTAEKLDYIEKCVKEFFRG
jgi:CDP-6-deoxy-D-xylo-4-hexulose-3-dehydrase|tara:strand:+ start:4733 stop:6064 length:1332 start_codon:yes stop_codon:yes gene_type:complete